MPATQIFASMMLTQDVVGAAMENTTGCFDVNVSDADLEAAAEDSPVNRAAPSKADTPASC